MGPTKVRVLFITLGTFAFCPIFILALSCCFVARLPFFIH